METRTHSFHLPFGEVGITLQDVEVLLGLPVDDIPLAGITGRSKDHWIQICDDMMGFRPEASDITSSMIKISAIVPKALTDHSVDVDYLQHARAIMFKLLGGSLFPNTTGNKVSLYLLEVIMGDSVVVRGRAIGVAVLSFLYRSMCRATMTHVAQIGGCLVLLQLSSWERLPMTRPRGVVPLEQLVNVPYGVRWVCYHRWSDCTTHSLRAYRDQLDRLLEGELSCMVDCHQRLDRGRHPDGFVPSHEVVRVHDLLEECIRALGHTSILDHPQEQPVYNLGHIRRRADRRRDAPAVGVKRGEQGQRSITIILHTKINNVRRQAYTSCSSLECDVIQDGFQGVESIYGGGYTKTHSLFLVRFRRSLCAPLPFVVPPARERDAAAEPPERRR
ncbi:unnamed protein product [Cuscuta campestris]|uniref:Aminotransferase-like plant mobile domain-containing protein n=1 Tax=Cuscuta campestris TaxID=132261 RepID=A0A484KR37_9ASTE|nr:unnamed protein product [Cuscuta campestris]